MTLQSPNYALRAFHLLIEVLGIPSHICTTSICEYEEIYNLYITQIDGNLKYDKYAAGFGSPSLNKSLT
jgi:hypothetical protein